MANTDSITTTKIGARLFAIGNISLNTSLDGADTIDEVLRVYVAMNYDQYLEESVINLLLGEPDIAVVIEDEVSTESRNARKNVGLHYRDFSRCQ